MADLAVLQARGACEAKLGEVLDLALPAVFSPEEAGLAREGARLAGVR